MPGYMGANAAKMVSFRLYPSEILYLRERAIRERTTQIGVIRDALRKTDLSLTQYEIGEGEND